MQIENQVPASRMTLAALKARLRLTYGYARGMAGQRHIVIVLPSRFEPTLKGDEATRVILATGDRLTASAVQVIADSVATGRDGMVIASSLADAGAAYAALHRAIYGSAA